MTSPPPFAFSPRRLRQQDAPQVPGHFMRLSAPDRSQRFWDALVTDDTITGYVRSLRFEGAAMALTREEDEWHARRRLDGRPCAAESLPFLLPMVQQKAQPSCTPVTHFMLENLRATQRQWWKRSPSHDRSA